MPKMNFMGFRTGTSFVQTGFLAGPVRDKTTIFVFFCLWLAGHFRGVQRLENNNFGLAVYQLTACFVAKILPNICNLFMAPGYVKPHTETIKHTPQPSNQAQTAHYACPGRDVPAVRFPAKTPTIS